MISTRIEMFDILAAGAAVIEYDLTNRIITWATGPAERMFGYALGELVGQPIEVLVPLPRRNMHQKHVERYAAAPAARTMGPELQLEGQHKNGTCFPVAVQLCHGWSGSLACRQQVAIAVVIDLRSPFLPVRAQEVILPLPIVEETQDAPASAALASLTAVGMLKLSAVMYGMAAVSLLLWLLLWLRDADEANVIDFNDLPPANTAHLQQNKHQVVLAVHGGQP